MAWEQLWDEGSRQFYFYDNVNGVTQWEVPADFEGDVQANEVEVEHDVACSLLTTVAQDEHTKSTEWIKCFDEASGMWFFFNQKTAVTQWDEPIDFDPDVENEYVAVITEYKPLCARCFGTKTPLYKSKLFYFVLFLAIIGIGGGLFLALGDCKSKNIKKTYTEYSSVNTTTTINTTVSKNVTNETTSNYNQTNDMDVVFIYDKSNSMQTEEVENEQANIKTMILQFNATLGPGKLKVAVISFGCFASAEVNLTYDLAGAVAAVEASGTGTTGCTRTDLALDDYVNMMLSPKARNESSKVAVLMSDGSVCCRPKYLTSALATAQNIKDENQTVLSVYVNNRPSAETANEMWRLSSCAPNSTGSIEYGAHCPYYFNGTFDELTAASQGIAESIAFSVGSDTVYETATITASVEATVSSTTTATTTTSQDFTENDKQCVFDPRWYAALLLILPLLIYLLLRYCVVPVANKAEEVMEEAMETMRESTYAPAFFPSRQSLPPQQEDSPPNPILEEETLPPSFTQESPTPETNPVTMNNDQPKKKWETVKTNHYLWAMQGGTTKLNVDFGKNFEADSLPSAPSAVDKSGKVMIKLVKDVEKEYKTTARSSIVTRASTVARNDKNITVPPIPPPSEQVKDNKARKPGSRKSTAILSRRGTKFNNKKTPQKTVFFSWWWLCFKRCFGCTRHSSSKNTPTFTKEEKRPSSARVELGALGSTQPTMFASSNPYSSFNNV